MEIDVRLEGTVGNNPVYTDGTKVGAKLDKNLNTDIILSHGNYREAVSRGNVNIASVAVTGIAIGSAFSTTPPLAVWNPIGSNVTLSILKTTLAYLSGTLSYGIVAYCSSYQGSTVPTTGTELVPKNALIGSSKGKGRAFTGSTIATAGTVIIAPYSFGVEAATTAVGITRCQDMVDGLIEVPPGSLFIIEATAAAAGTSDLMVISASWEEIPIV
jgi:hypothetical protein